MAGLVLEGGSFRGIFSAGLMDALLDHGIMFDYVIGVSAGISNGVSYVSKQKGRNLEILQKFRNDKRYMSKRNMLTNKSIFGMDFVFDEVPNRLVPFDYDTYQTFSGKVRVGITDAVTGEAVYKDGHHLDKKFTLLRATCAIPMLFPAVTIDGRAYFDGGLADSIPIRQSIKDGNVKNLVVLTQPKGFVKTQSKNAQWMAKYYHKKFPGVTATLLNRPKMYNDTLRYIEHLEREEPDNILVLQPAYALSSMEKDVATLEKTYQHGYDIAVRNMERIRALL